MAKKSSGKKGARGNGAAAGTGARVGASPMDLGLLEQITRLMRENDLNTIDLREGEKRVIIKRGAVVTGPGSGYVVAPQFAPAHPPQGAHPANPSGPAGGSSSASGGSAESDTGLVPIKSPMVGTFYAAASPDAKPFVSVGSQVDEETDVCIIEAMKVFNNIKAETKGTIAKVLIQNGQTVEFGQPLFLVKPA